MTTARPWERTLANPWQTAQPLFERVVTVKRPFQPSAVGSLSYSGFLPTSETTLYTGLTASIQYQPKRDRPLAQVPTDATSEAQWRIFIPYQASTSGPFMVPVAGSIVERDVIVDDYGRRFRTFAVEPTPLGLTIAAELLES